jgi:hypothetical protein
LVVARLWRNWIESATAQTLRSARLGIKNAENSATFLYVPIPAEPSQHALLFLSPVASYCFQLSPFVAFCFQLSPIVAFCRQLSPALALFLWGPFVASRGLLRLFVASSCMSQPHLEVLFLLFPVSMFPSK